jgi:acetyl esterase/lipase
MSVKEPPLEQLLGDLAVWPAPSQPTRHPYGSDPAQHADLWQPAGEARGLVVLLHGGFWRAKYDKAYMNAAAISLTDAGWAVWNVEYRRVGAGGGWPTTFDDVRSARAAAPPAPRVAAVGHSAGGHLALLLAAHGLVDTAVGLGSVCDLQAAVTDRLGDGAAVAFMGSAEPTAWRDADPRALAPPPVPVTLIHGVDDDTVPVAHARAYNDSAGGRSTLVELPCGHFEPVDPRSAAWPHVIEALG